MITAEKSRFYCPEERKLHGNGNKYDLAIDNIIIQTLYTNKSLSYGKLKSTVEEKYGRSHIRSFSDRIKSLVDNGILSSALLSNSFLV